MYSGRNELASSFNKQEVENTWHWVKGRNTPHHLKIHVHLLDISNFLDNLIMTRTGSLKQLHTEKLLT